jgi:hypothetical protein
MTSFLQGHLSGSFRPGTVLNAVPDTSSGSFPTVVGTASNATSGTGATSFTPTLPSYSAGDVVIVIVSSTSSLIDITTGVGWQQADLQQYSGGSVAIFTNVGIGASAPLIVVGEVLATEYKYASVSICLRSCDTIRRATSGLEAAAVTSTDSPGRDYGTSNTYAIQVASLGLAVPSTVTAPSEWQFNVVQKKHPGVAGPTAALTWLADRTGSANPGAWTHDSSVSAASFMAIYQS